MGGGQTISEAIGADHDSFDVYVANLKSATDDAEKARWRNQLTWTLARHAISEELTLYPAMEKWLGEEGAKLSKTDKEQHAGVKDYLYKIQDLTPVDPNFVPLLDTLMDLVHHHVEHERDEDMPRLEKVMPRLEKVMPRLEKVMPRLEKVMPRGESEKLADLFQRTKGIVPSRSHPAAPTEFYAEGLVGLLAMPVDRLRNWLQDFPTEEDERRAEGERERE